jgi:uncharacterized protein YdaU (DUF1376 family)
MKYPWMPLFWGDFLANTMHLSAQEAGAYLFLIAHAWEHEGEIPTEPVRLARIAHVRQDQWKKVWPALEEFFDITRDGPSISRTTHRRVMDELDRLGKISNKRSAAAKQMHGKSNGNAHASTSRSTIESSSNEKGTEPRARRDDASLELQLAQKRHLGISPDKGMDYRAPPAKKSDNVLAPIPEKQRIEPQDQKQAADKEP